MALKSLVRVILAGLMGAFLTVSAPAFAKKDQCVALKTQADCTKKKECSWSGKACAKAAAAKPAKKDDKKATSAKSKKDGKTAADKKKADDKKAEEAKKGDDGMPPMDEGGTDAAAGDEDF